MRLILLLVFVASCSFKNSQLSNQVLKGHEQLYSEVEKAEKVDSKYKRIVIASTNDIQGHIDSLDVSLSDGIISLGGKEIIAQYFSILRDQYKNVLLVDAGDILPRDYADLDRVKGFYQDLKYDAVTVGIDDFNMKLEKDMRSSIDLFKKFSHDNKTPLLLSNIYDLKTAMNIEWEGSKPYVMKEIDGVKVGVIGLVPDDLVNLTTVQNRVGIFVENTVQSTMKHARLLRSLGAQIIVVMTHQGIDCSEKLSQKTNLPLTKVNFEPRRTDACDLTSPLGIFLERMPPHLVDVVVAGRNHQKMANFINETLVIGGWDQGRSFNYVEFFVDKDSKKVVFDKTVVHQPVLFCSEFFAATEDCYPEDASVKHEKRMPAEFLGVEIKKPKLAALSQSQELFSSTVSDIEEVLKKTNTDIAFVAETYGASQMVEVEMSGAKLSALLEEDYNRLQKRNSWMPSPFAVKNDELTLTVSGAKIDQHRTYKIFGDLESFRKHSKLRKLIGLSSTKAYLDTSWVAKLNTTEDAVNSTLAAPEHQ
jgi:hypothetical protein